MESDLNLEGIKAKAETLYNELILKSTELEKRFTKVNEYFTSVKVDNKDYQKTWDSLKSIFSSANDSVIKFNADKQTISKLFKETQSFYEQKYLPLREKILDPENGLAKNIQLSKFQKNEIEKIGTFCENQFGKIKENVKIHLDTLKVLIDLEKKVQKIFSEITIKGNQSKNLLTDISETKRTTDKLSKEISINAKKSKELEGEILDLQLRASAGLDSIIELKHNSESTFKEILSIYEIAADTGRSGEFDRRRKALTFDLKKWERNLFYSTLFLLIFVICLFLFQLYLYDFKVKDAGSDVNFYIRFILASPIVFYLTFCSIQYNHIRKLIDQYSFKTTLAVSIKSHLELFKNDSRFTDTQHINDILKFTISAFENIYKEPYNADEMKLNLKLKAIELNFEKKNEMKSKIESIESRLNDITIKSMN